MKRFVILYIFYIVIFFFMVDYEPMRRLLRLEEFYNGFVTALSARLIEWMGISVTSSSNVLHLPHANMIVKFGCNGLEAVLIYIAGVLAYPAPWKVKVRWGVAGVLFLEVVNLFRIALLAYVLEYHRSEFDLMHDYVTQSVMIVLAFLLFLLFLQRVGDASFDR
jgi:exosortase/archaeosortase family protein